MVIEECPTCRRIKIPPWPWIGGVWILSVSGSFTRRMTLCDECPLEPGKLVIKSNLPDVTSHHPTSS
jgi:hypothetical protein